jgi:hypothetical protein
MPVAGMPSLGDTRRLSVALPRHLSIIPVQDALVSVIVVAVHIRLTTTLIRRYFVFFGVF